MFVCVRVCVWYGVGVIVVVCGVCGVCSMVLVVVLVVCVWYGDDVVVVVIVCGICVCNRIEQARISIPLSFPLLRQVEGGRKLQGRK